MFVRPKAAPHIEIEWDLDASTALTSGGNTGRIRHDGQILEIKHPITQQVVQVSNGPFAIGNSWYEAKGRRFESFGELVNSLFPK